MFVKLYSFVGVSLFMNMYKLVRYSDSIYGLGSLVSMDFEVGEYFHLLLSSMTSSHILMCYLSPGFDEVDSLFRN